jgi:hypothetical protein
MTKSEGRNPKAERSPKAEIRIPKQKSRRTYSAFGLRRPVKAKVFITRSSTVNAVLDLGPWIFSGSWILDLGFRPSDLVSSYRDPILAAKRKGLPAGRHSGLFEPLSNVQVL